MRIVLVAAGAGAMYCGACARDAALARMLGELGHDAIVVPLYTPVRLEEDLPMEPVQFGGVTAYLRQIGKPPPPWLTRWLDHPRVLGWAGRFAVSTSPKDLGPMTVGMLRGLDGPHRSALLEAAAAIGAHSPDLVILSNSLLLGLAPAITVPVVVQVQGEDGFLDELPTEWRDQAESLLRGYVSGVRSIVAPSRSYAATIAPRLGVASEAISVVPHAIRVGPPSPRGPGNTVGYLSSIRRAKGLDVLLRALPPEIRIRVGGRVLEPDFAQECEAIAPGARLEGEIAPADKARFLSEIDVLALPTRLIESRGVIGLEALAHGRPVVATDAGVYGEWARETRAVRVVPKDDVAALRAALEDVLATPELGQEGAAWVASRFSPDAVREAIRNWLGATACD